MVNGVNLYRQDDKVMGRLANDSSPQPQTAMLAKGNELGKAPSSMKMLGMIYGGEKPEGSGDHHEDIGHQEPIEPELECLHQPCFSASRIAWAMRSVPPWLPSRCNPSVR